MTNDTRHIAEHFSNIFTDWAEAEWAFDLLRETIRRLRVHDPYDPRVAVTLPQRSGRYFLHLNFGSWLVLGFRGPGQQPERADIALLANSVTWDERFFSFSYERKEGEPEVRGYQLPLTTLHPMTTDLEHAFFTTLDFIADKFQSWKKSTRWKHHNPEIIEACFDPEKRALLLAGGLDDVELRYDRHFTAFHYELAEESEEYVVGGGEDTMMRGDESISNITGSSPMKIISIDKLNGIENEFQQDIFLAMKNCSNTERLLVCLYFLSDVPDERRTLSFIEENLRKIFPPSLRDGKTPEEYTNFQASTIRGYLGEQDRKFRDEVPITEEQIWKTYGRGFWRNTEYGSQLAIEVLEREGIRVIVGNNQPSPQTQPPFPLSTIAEQTGLDETDLARWVRAIERKGQAVLYGPPGTGKTFVAEKLAAHLVGGGDGFVDLVQFHPAYAYEDFIQGIRPQSIDGHLSYPNVPGRFLEFCRKAEGRDGLCVLIIDEINRANLSRVFGELMYLLEYRNRAIPLAGGGQLKIPQNVRLIGTMNTADRSIALVDHALRRRFAFIELEPNFNALRHFHRQAQTNFSVDALVRLLTRLNQEIGDPHYAIGITFFLHQNLAAEIADIWQMEIEPYLQEYFFDQPEKVDTFRWQAVSQELDLADL